VPVLGGAIFILAEANLWVLSMGSALRVISHRNLSEVDVTEARTHVWPITNRLVKT